MENESGKVREFQLCLHLPLSQRNLPSRVPLKVMVFHSAVAAHQTNAILCLSLLKELAEKLGRDKDVRCMYMCGEN